VFGISSWDNNGQADNAMQNACLDLNQEAEIIHQLPIMRQTRCPEF
jgi:hypothetical protein